jgi:hypothetical protein
LAPLVQAPDVVAPMGMFMITPGGISTEPGRGVGAIGAVPGWKGRELRVCYAGDCPLVSPWAPR